MTDTSAQVLSDCGVRFILRVATKLRDKPKAPSSTANPSMKTNAQWQNPFLPPDPDLFICHVSPTHSLVLNKFNIVPYHTLVITREFEPQEYPLTPADFDATWAVLQAMPEGGLAYFNCGPQSGASQPHKHLQVLPLPLIPVEHSGEGVSRYNVEDDPPFWPIVASSMMDASPGPADAMTLASLPFANFVARLDPLNSDGKMLAATYAHLADKAEKEVASGASASGRQRSSSVNMIMTRQFMMVVPRRCESVGPVNCNAMAFAGSFFVRSVEELEFIRQQGPMNILEEVGFSRSRS